MKLYLFGASGTGVTTLGRALGQALSLPYFDTDAYYWLPSDPPFTVRRPAAARDAALAEDFTAHPAWVLGGSLVSWGTQWLTDLDLVVFLWLPPALRLRRLHQRELERYGNVIFTDPTRAAQTQAFLDWAAGYDDNSCGGSRTLATHTAWLGQFTSPVLELRGDLSETQRLEMVLARLQKPVLP
ncbi:adenylate kinase [Hymenobacter sp. BT683]|uniref:Adenylate kinase n=1 Tax=Hymenobacter jeongseonensis TaxID=2791027 RepID=A0ABS0IEE0_9BACT|nr:adenylate kinase [Hymenobacter jeongseonensis]MBF9236717.1 adenylate kinase [Hymenobacter jeongseonensis]